MFQATVPVSRPDGSRFTLHRSLGTDDAAQAAAIESGLRALADSLPGKKTPWRSIERAVQDIFVAAGHEAPLIVREPVTVQRPLLAFAGEYLERKKRKVQASHHALLSRCILGFARKHKALDLGEVGTPHVQAWVDSMEGTGLASGSVRNRLFALNAMFAFSVRQGFIKNNPCSGVDFPDAEGVVNRMPMGDADFQRLVAFLEKHGETEWQGAALLGRYAGLRLGDAVQVTGQAVAWEDGACLLDVTPGKTGVRACVPVFGPLPAFLRRFEGAEGVLAPGLAKLSVSSLSEKFTGLCEEAGLDLQATQLPGGRTVRKISFHSLRHSYRTWLWQAGLPPHLSMKLMGHTTMSAHEQYSHHDALALHGLVAKYVSK